MAIAQTRDTRTLIAPSDFRNDIFTVVSIDGDATKLKETSEASNFFPAIVTETSLAAEAGVTLKQTIDLTEGDITKGTILDPQNAATGAGTRKITLTSPLAGIPNEEVTVTYTNTLARSAQCDDLVEEINKTKNFFAQDPSRF